MRFARSLALIVAVMVVPFGHPALSAEPYPIKPVRLIVPWPPGGGTDAVARLVGQRVTEELGQQVVVENRGGAGTIIGIDATAKAEPDAYTFGIPTQSFAVNATLQAKLPYDTLGDFEPVILMGTGLYVLVVNPNVKAQTLGELIALLKAAPGDMAAGFSGHGSPSHLGLVEFVRRAGAKPIDVNYRGTGPAVTALLGGEIQFIFTTLAGVLPHIKSGRLRALAVTSDKRTALLPDLPTAVESGLSDFVVFEWYGLLAPKGAPRNRTEFMNAAVRKVLALPELQEKLRAIGAEPLQNGTPEEFATFIRSEVTKWGKLVRDANLKPE